MIWLRFMILLLIFQGCKQHPKTALTDAAQYNFKGRIKNVVSRTYIHIEEQNGSWVPKDTSGWYIQFNMHFSPGGAVEETVMDVNQRQLNAGPQYNKTVFTSRGNRALSSVVYNREGMVNSRSEFIWVNERRLMRKQYNADGKLFLTDETWLKDNLQPDYREFKVLQGDTLLQHEKQTFFYDNHERPVRIENYFVKTKETKNQLFRHFELDRAGNPRLSYQYQGEKKKPDEITVREFEYY